MTVPKISHKKSLTEQVMDYVREAALTGGMVTGEWYSVYQLSEQLGISRSPVRDALLRLEEAGLISFTRNRGFQFVETNPSDVADIFALRLGIEPAAAFRAAQYRTEEQLTLVDQTVGTMHQLALDGKEDEFFLHDKLLHELILTMGSSRRGIDLVSKLRNHTRILGVSTAGNSRTLSDILAEHEPILRAIRQGSPDVALASMREHLQITGKLLLRQNVNKLDCDDPDQQVSEIWSQYTDGL